MTNIWSKHAWDKRRERFTTLSCHVNGETRHIMQIWNMHVSQGLSQLVLLGGHTAEADSGPNFLANSVQGSASRSMVSKCPASLTAL